MKPTSLIYFLGLLSLLVTCVAKAETSNPEGDFLQSRLRLTESYTTIDTQTKEEYLKENRLLVPLINATDFLRDTELFLATGGLVKAALAGGTFVSATGMAAKVAQIAIPMIPSGLAKWMSTAPDNVIQEAIEGVKGAVDNFYSRIDLFSLSSSSEAERLYYHQQNFEDFLETREEVDAIFEAKSNEIFRRRLSFGAVWDYGRDQHDLYNLQLLHYQAELAIDSAEQKYIEQSLQRISG